MSNIFITAKIKKIIFYKNDWGILACAPISNKGDITLNKQGEFTCKGIIPNVREGIGYDFVLEETIDGKYGLQYEIKSINIHADLTNRIGKKQYLLGIFTERQVTAMYEALEDPFQALKDKSYYELVKIKGCGQRTAPKWCAKFDEFYAYHRLFIELQEYNLSFSVMQKLMKTYHSTDLIIQKIKENPYLLVEAHGISWKIADSISLQSGIDKYDIRRIGAYILYYLTYKCSSGSTWVTNEEIMDNLINELGEDIPDLNITEAMRSIQDKLWWNEDKTHIGLLSMRELEEQIADELLRLRDAQLNFKYDNWLDIIHEREERQGWKYTDQQIEAIKMALENNIIVVQGNAGTGKTTIVSAILSILNQYTFAQCALAGKAGARLAETSGKEGYTIHRLLGYPKAKDHQGFLYNEDNQLSQDIIVIDEISMIGGRLFYYLLRAIKSGAKVIMLGDIGQLEAIGECKVAVDMINSSEIPTAFLDKIHRQAAKSAIITDSICMRKGGQIIPKDYSGVEVHGELKDLEYNIFSDKSNTFYVAMQYVSKLLSDNINIMNMQVISPRKTMGDACTYNLNLAIQNLYNPSNNNKDEIMNRCNGKDFLLRVGDKIINTKNRTNTTDADNPDLIVPIFNGNVGILEKITYDDGLVVNFENIGRVYVDSDYLDGIELGYAISYHKMQGGQVDYLIACLDFTAYTLLSRQMVYTGITRAKKKCYLVAQNNALRYAISQEKNSLKNTSLCDILYEKTHKKFIF